jgi:hypothetical protein
VDGTDNFDLAFGFTELETAGTDRVVTPVSMGSSTSRGHQNATPALRRPEISHLTAIFTVLKMTIIGTVMDWNGGIAQ